MTVTGIGSYVLAVLIAALIILLGIMIWSEHPPSRNAIQAGANVAHGVLLPDVAGSVGKGVTSSK